MGRVRTKTVKKASRAEIERYYWRMTMGFHTDKKMVEEVALVPSKLLRNKIAGFSTRLMRRIQRGPVRGISLRLQEDEPEGRTDFFPERSAISTHLIEGDPDTLQLLSTLGMPCLPGVVKISDPPASSFQPPIPYYPPRRLPAPTPIHS